MYTGDIHAAGNPHYIIDPVNGKTVAETISLAVALCRGICVQNCNLGHFWA